MKTFISGRDAFVELKEEVDKQSRSAVDTNDVLVILEPHDVTILEVRYIETAIVLFSETDDLNKLTAIPISNGNPFTVSIAFIPKRGILRRVTQFTEHS